MSYRDSRASGFLTAVVMLLLILQAGAHAQSSRKTTPSASRHPQVETGSVVSADGAGIGYRKFGRGPALVVSHGTHTVAQDWDAFAREMGKRRTVYVYDRRGRGSSPDAGKRYTESSELDDLAAMVKRAGPNTAVFGHSFGGGVALAYALRDGFRGRLIVYEPGHSVLQKVSRGYVPQIQALLDEKRYEYATEFAFENVGRFPKAELAKLRLSPLWPSMVQLNRLYPRELTFLDTLTWTPEQLQGLKARTWMLFGVSAPDPGRRGVPHGCARGPHSRRDSVSTKGPGAYCLNVHLKVADLERALDF